MEAFGILFRPHVVECLIFIFSRIADLSTRYRENLQLVLKDLTVEIQPGEKVNSILKIECI
jgi:hypothetical protein